MSDSRVQWITKTCARDGCDKLFERVPWQAKKANSDSVNSYLGVAA